jgi:hypothetical protein
LPGVVTESNDTLGLPGGGMVNCGMSWEAIRPWCMLASIEQMHGRGRHVGVFLCSTTSIRGSDARCGSVWVECSACILGVAQLAFFHVADWLY